MIIRFIGFFFFLQALSGLNCTGNRNGGINELVSGNKPEIVIRIQPFKDIDSSTIRILAHSIRAVYPNLVVNEPADLPANAYYSLRGRYKADSLLDFLSSMAKPFEVMIGVTTKDISTQKDDIPDWGVMGLGESPGKTCVVSTYRLVKARISDQLFKVAIHELGHTQGLPHCPDPSCYMRDAEGGNPTDAEKGFCKKCGAYLRKKNWRI